MLCDDESKKVEALFHRYAKGVGSYVLARVGDAEAAEHITGRVFLAVVDKFGQCRASPVGWMWAIVRREVARYFRDRKVVLPLDPQWPDPRLDPHAAAAEAEMRGRLSAALEKLPEEQHRLLYMKFFLDMPNVDIAKECGLSAVNVGVSVHRAIKQLRTLMAEGAADGSRLSGGTR